MTSLNNSNSSSSNTRTSNSSTTSTSTSTFTSTSTSSEPASAEDSPPSNVPPSFWNSMGGVPPAPMFAIAGIPCLYQAWRDYKAPFLSPETAAALLEETAEDSLKRAAASQIATRALRVATSASVGATCLVTSAGLAWAGYRNLGTAWEDARRLGRHTFGSLLEDETVPQRLGLHPDRSHPDFSATANMNEDQEMEYIAEKYFPGQDWTQPDGMQKQRMTNQPPNPGDTPRSDSVNE